MSLMKVARKTTAIALCVSILLSTNGGASAAYNYVQNGTFSSFTAFSGSGNSTSSPTQGQLGAWINATDWTSANDKDGVAATNLLFAANTSSTTGSHNVTGDSTQYYLYGNSGGTNTGIVSPTGGGFVALDGDSQYLGAISQSISGLTVGYTYALNFDWAGAQQTGNSGSTKDSLTVSLGSESHTTATVTNLSQGFTGWMNTTMSFTATSSTEVLSFLSYATPDGIPPYLLVSDIALTVPEPSSIALVSTGLIALLGLGYRRRMARTAKA